MKEIKTESTSLSSAITNDIILRETNTSRLLFRPLLVKNPHNEAASIKGTFIFQRKSRTENWEDYKTLNLTQLKKGEWIQLTLKSAEVLDLFKKLQDLYSLYEQEGLPVGKRSFLKTDEGLGSLISANVDELNQLLDSETRDATTLLSRLIIWLSKTDKPNEIVDKLEDIEVTGLKQLSSIAGLSIMKSSLSIWEDNKNIKNEEFWQTCLTDYSFVLSQLFSQPVIVIKEKAYMGGKTINNTGGNIVDFLARNEISNNAVLIEIKTPLTPLLGSRYRTNAYSVSKEISGAIVQVANYRHSLQRGFLALSDTCPQVINSFEPKCLVIAGNYSRQLDNPTKKKSFELFRENLQNIQIITYDELFGKVKMLIELLEGNIGNEDIYAPIFDDDLPF